jgi:hypothetical protein
VLETGLLLLAMLVVLVLESVLINGWLLRKHLFPMLLFDFGVHPKYVLNYAIEEFINVFSRLHGTFPNAKGIKSVIDGLEVRGQPIQDLGGLCM